MYNRIPEKFSTDILVIGAGLAGVCAAINAARNGCSVTLLEKFRTLGGNGGPEVGVHPSGAHRFHPYAAETGVMEEMVEEAAFRGAKTFSYGNHYNMSQMWDTVLSDTLKEAGVKVLRCHYAKEPVVENGKATYRFLAKYVYRSLLCKDVYFRDEQEYRIILLNDAICKGTSFLVRYSHNIRVMDLDDFFDSM